VRVLGAWTNRATRTDREGRYAFAGFPLDVALEVEVASPAGVRVQRSVRLTETGTPTTRDVSLPDG